jgi:polyisoprenoid-binding protein YceI
MMAKPLLLLALLAITARAGATDYVQAPGSTLAFGGMYQDDAFAGRVPRFSTTLSFDPADLAHASLDVAIGIGSATTANQDYDEGMLGAAFFDVARFPDAHYHATRFRSLGGNRYAADGTLSLHGVEQPVTLEFTWTPGAHPVLAGKATVHRLAFGVGAGDWADTDLIPDAIAVSTRVLFDPR